MSTSALENMTMTSHLTSPLHLSGDDEVEPEIDAEPENMDITEAELNDPTNLEHIEKSLAYKELELRAKHADELATMFAAHPSKKETIYGSKKLQLATKEQGRQAERMKAYKTRFAKNKILAKRKRDERFASVRAVNAEEKAMEKAVAATVRASLKKQQDLAYKAAMAAVKDMGGELSDQAMKEAALAAFAEALKKPAPVEAEA